MRRIVMFNRVTADGFFAGPEGELDWVVPDDQVDKAGAAAIPGYDTVLFGRRTYEMFASFWPHALDDDGRGSPNPHDGRAHSPEMRAMATMLNESLKIVFSRSQKNATWKNSVIVHEFEARAIDDMKRQPGKDIIVFGSGSIVSALTRHELIDEYQFVVCPVLLGSGRSLLSDATAHIGLHLVDSTAYPSGNLMLRYAPSRRAGAQ